MHSELFMTNCTFSAMKRDENSVKIVRIHIEILFYFLYNNEVGYNMQLMCVIAANFSTINVVYEVERG